jgi:hypothetical protein
MKLFNTRIGLLIFVVLFFNSAESENLNRTLGETLAVVGTRVITVGKFAETYKTKLVKLGLTDNMDTQVGFLNNLVNAQSNLKSTSVIIQSK